jgi:hypothetical protein
MKIEVGKRYVRRDSTITKPLVPDYMPDSDFALDPETELAYGTRGEPLDHQVFTHRQMHADLMSEYVE